MVMDMLNLARMEEQFQLLGMGTLLRHLRASANDISNNPSIRKGANMNLMFCIRSQSTHLCEVLEEVLHMQTRAGCWYQVPAFFFRACFVHSATVHELMKAVQDFVALRDFVVKEHSNYAPRHLLYDSPTSIGMDIQTSARSRMVGRSELVEKMVKILLMDRVGHTDVSIPFVMPIVGAPGIGKTRLAQALFDDGRIKGKFHVQHWVHVSQQFNLRKILMRILNTWIEAEFSRKTAKILLHHALREVNYLLILDDVWYVNAGEWDTLMQALPSNGTIIFTSRIPAIASRMPTTKSYFLQPLEQEFLYSFVDEWNDAHRKQEYLNYFMGQRSDSHHVHGFSGFIEEVAMVIAKKCGGVPLLLEYACRLLQQSQNIQAWEGFMEVSGTIYPDEFWKQLLTYIDTLSEDSFWERFLQHFDGQPGGNIVSDSALVSYHHLPSELLSCLLYCALYPLDYDFDVEELGDHLVAQHFIPSTVTHTQRGGFLQQLLDEFFYPLEEEQGRKATYRMHKILHIYAQYMQRKVSAVIPVGQKAPTVQRFIRHASLIVHSSSASFPTCLNQLNNLKTLIVLQNRRSCLSDSRCEFKEIPQSFYQSFRNIRVLSLRANKIRKLPKKFTMLLSELRYLDLSWTDIEVIPKSVSKLQNLQTLEVSHCKKLRKLHENMCQLVQLRKLNLEGCHHLVALPRNTSKMKSLEYLNVIDCSSLTQMPCNMGQLTNLQTLLGYVVCNSGENMLSELQSLPNLNKLTLENLEKVLDLDLVDARYANLQGKRNLASLTLKWNMDSENTNKNAYAVLESLQPHQRLKALEIVAYEGNKFPTWMTSIEPYLTSLSEIRLVNLKLLPPLGQLPCLKIAEISGAETVSCIKDSFYGHNGTFPSLERLTFSYMPNLVIWGQTPTENMFPRLRELVIIQCPKLKAVHMEFPSIEKLILWMDNRLLYTSEGSLKGLVKGLEHVSISFCDELLASSSLKGLQDLVELIELDISGCHELTCLPWGLQHLSSIESLTIDNCSKIETLPDWLENLPSLRVVRLSGCSMLGSIPQGLRLRCIDIIVEHCPNFSEHSSGIPKLILHEPISF